jgi:hypothetical protein
VHIHADIKSGHQKSSLKKKLRRFPHTTPVSHETDRQEDELSHTQSLSPKLRSTTEDSRRWEEIIQLEVEVENLKLPVNQKLKGMYKT